MTGGSLHRRLVRLEVAATDHAVDEPVVFAVVAQSDGTVHPAVAATIGEHTLQRQTGEDEGTFLDRVLVEACKWPYEVIVVD